MEFLDKSNIETALSELERVRQLLIDAYEATEWPDSFGNPISSDYPIKSQTSLQYHGWCEIIVPKNEWTRRMNMERAKEFSVLGLTVHLKANSEDESMLPIELLLPTFIHELAHSVTAPEKWRLNSINMKDSNQLIGSYFTITQHFTSTLPICFKCQKK